jgi:hypothetical protein
MVKLFPCYTETNQEVEGSTMTVVGPITSTQVSVVYDNDTGGFGGPADMTGPEIGRVSYSQPGDDLQLRIDLDFAQPNTTYQVFLVCGPAHAVGCGFTTIGTLTTNAVGAGATGVTVPFAVLQAAPYGPGYRTDHIDLMQKVGDLSKGFLTAGAINYFVCTREGVPGHDQPQILAASSDTGDPAGALLGPNDPAGAKQP